MPASAVAWSLVVAGYQPTLILCIPPGLAYTEDDINNIPDGADMGLICFDLSIG
jgi:hypothetical protein